MGDRGQSHTGGLVGMEEGVSPLGGALVVVHAGVLHVAALAAHTGVQHRAEHLVGLA